MSNGANSIHKQLRSELEDYIKAQYFGRSPLKTAWMMRAFCIRSPTSSRPPFMRAVRMVSRALSCPIGRNRSFCSFPRQGWGCIPRRLSIRPMRCKLPLMDGMCLCPQGLAPVRRSALCGPCWEN